MGVDPVGCSPFNHDSIQQHAHTSTHELRFSDSPDGRCVIVAAVLRAGSGVGISVLSYESEHERSLRSGLERLNASLHVERNPLGNILHGNSGTRKQ